MTEEVVKEEKPEVKKTVKLSLTDKFVETYLEGDKDFKKFVKSYLTKNVEEYTNQEINFYDWNFNQKLIEAMIAYSKEQNSKSDKGLTWHDFFTEHASSNRNKSFAKFYKENGD